MTATALYNKPSKDFSAKLAVTRNLLAQLAVDYAAPQGSASGVSGGVDALITQANSLGAEDMVVSHIINSAGLYIPIFVLDTGALHPETLALLDSFKATSAAPVRVFRPAQEAVLQFVAREGKEAMYKSIALRKACCGIRKMQPLNVALAGKTAWITGLRREQSDARADVTLVDRSNAKLTKYNPLADWTWGDVWHYINTHKVAYNELHDQFYPSIGCAPCTRAISLGEDFRAGRWWWEAALEGGAAKECGLHAKDTPQEEATA
jgi:phosphoadenosine phosphosulfate reductase